ncbi:MULTISPECIES: manganese efflux pump MntP [Pseudobutyrivibrio]|uniref:Putative manganese efflux pump MntP n=1 Tax=Pseudobutyrivibrio xylanivorans TaxID=185007 RepID=A0A1G5S444_PSEXY|nr:MULTISPECIES: manganese efflux pump MntP family protein [Pseudobutyrivibrio]MDC7279197.1 manganese efflux pump MntP family protein [Butyrivibrio fibrisolvens]SCZ80600.1 Putative Mn2+ efflux pump MntP [Pseudobutyrivibrio xylanivorans]
MSLLDILLLGVGLSMDAFAVAICKGLAMRKVNKRQMFVIALFFGGFQALMPLIGWALGTTFAKKIVAYDHWIAFILLLYVGGKMVVDAIKEWKDKDCVEEMDPPLDFKELTLLAIATSIDALACGVTFSFEENFNILRAIAIIGVTTFVISSGGVYVGNIFGDRYKAKAQLLGGIILIFLGVKILLEHTMGITLGF